MNLYATLLDRSKPRRLSRTAELEEYLAYVRAEEWAKRKPLRYPEWLESLKLPK